MITTTTVPSAQVAWRIPDWAAAVGIGRSKTYDLLARGAIRSVRLGSARLITTPPREYVDSLPAAE